MNRGNAAQTDGDCYPFYTADENSSLGKSSVHGRSIRGCTISHQAELWAWFGVLGSTTHQNKYNPHPTNHKATPGSRGFFSIHRRLVLRKVPKIGTSWIRLEQVGTSWKEQKRRKEVLNGPQSSRLDWDIQQTGHGDPGDWITIVQNHSRNSRASMNSRIQATGIINQNQAESPGGILMKIQYRLLLSDINFWRRCWGVSAYSRDNSVGQGYQWITLLIRKLLKRSLEVYLIHLQAHPHLPSLAEEREGAVPPEAPRMTMYQLLHPTQSSIPSCIMFPPNAPHVEIKQGLMAILPDFRGLENENPYVHVRAFEEVIGSFYAQNVIETSKLRFFPFSLKDKAKGWLYTLKPRSIGNWGEMTQEFYKKFFPPYKVQQLRIPTPRNGPSPLDSTDRNRSSTTTSGGSVFRLREEDNMNAKISLLTKEIEALKLKGSRGVNAVYREESYGGMPICQEIDHTTSACEQNQRFETMFTRIEMRETKSQVARLTEALSRTERGKLPSQTQPNPNNQSLKVVNTDKFEEVKSITILRSAEKDESGIAKSNDIEKVSHSLHHFPQALKLPKNLDVTSEILEHLHQVKVNLPLLHIIKQMPLYAKVIKDLCTVKRKHHVKKTAFLTEQVSAIIQHKVSTESTRIQAALQSLVLLETYMIEHSLARSWGQNGRMKITFGSMTAELNIFNVNPQQLVDEECEYVNFIEAAPQEEFNKNCFSDPFETLPFNFVTSIELKPNVKLSDFSSLLDSSQMLEEEQVVVAEKPPRSKKSLHCIPRCTKVKVEATTKRFTLCIH
uniref:Retrotransposon gag domain-containing protein n=1 Tax=Fagus sylvatica TaxID=28930 RepID=A0A2N9EFX0_FAGSY